MGPIYIKTSYINGLHLFWDSFERFCLQIWNKKEHNIIICRVISCHIGPLYNETPYK